MKICHVYFIQYNLKNEIKQKLFTRVNTIYNNGFMRDTLEGSYQCRVAARPSTQAPNLVTKCQCSKLACRFLTGHGHRD